MAHPAPAPPRDPRSDVKPDYAAGSAADHVVRLAARLSIAEDRAREVAVACWNFEHQRAVRAWEEYQASVAAADRPKVEGGQRQADEDWRPKEEEEPSRQAEEGRRRQEQEDLRRERELHRSRELRAHPARAAQQGTDAASSTAATTFTFPKIGQELVGTRTEYGVAEYALTALRDPTKRVDFWYFTDAGRDEARQLALASVEDDASTGIHGTLDPATNTFSFTRVSATGLPSRNALPDASLTLRQLSEAKRVFAKYAKQSGWDAAHIQAFVVLITRLEEHAAPLRYPEFGERALVRYFADVRREYHTALALKASTVPDISIINEDRVNNILTEMINAAAMKALADLRRIAEPYDAMSGTAPSSPLSGQHAARVASSQYPGSSLHAGQRRPSSTRDRYSTIIPRSSSSSFQSSALGGRSATSACAVCLGRHSHRTRDCNENKLHYYDRVRAYVRRGDDGRSLWRASDGNEVCLRFNVPRGCENITCSSGLHCCSGCGSTDHSAQGCSLSQDMALPNAA